MDEAGVHSDMGRNRTVAAIDSQCVTLFKNSESKSNITVICCVRGDGVKEVNKAGRKSTKVGTGYSKPPNKFQDNGLLKDGLQ